MEADLTFTWPTYCSSMQLAKRTAKQHGGRETSLLESDVMDQDDTSTTGKLYLSETQFPNL